MTLDGGAPRLGQFITQDNEAPTTPAPTAPATDPAVPAAQDGGVAPASVGAAPDAATSPKTPEEIDAFWRKRVSEKDKAHAAAEQALREELESLKRTPSAGATSSNGQPGTAGQEDPRIAELTRQLEAEKVSRLIDGRKAKYPHLAGQVGNADGIFSSADEATLAKLNALADDSDPGGTFIAPTGPKRAPSTAAKPLHEKSKAELEADLKAATPGYVEWARNTRG